MNGTYKVGGIIQRRVAVVGWAPGAYAGYLDRVKRPGEPPPVDIAEEPAGPRLVDVAMHSDQDRRWVRDKAVHDQ